MTAVATPLSLQPTPRTTWGTSNSAQGGVPSMSADDVSRMFMPRKSAQRTNSLASTASSSSSTSTITQQSSQASGPSQTPFADANGSIPRKKLGRGSGAWPPSKIDPVAVMSTGRSLPISSSTPGPPAAAINASHQPSPILPSQQSLGPQPQQNGSRSGTGTSQGESQVILHLLPINGTFERKTINVPFFPDVVRIGRQTNVKTVPTPVNGYFDSKVLSRQHAEVWSDRSGKIWIRDVKSSNGTFVNGHRLSAENRESEPHEIHEQDILELGIDIVSEDQKTVVHHKVSARVEHAGVYGNGASVLDLNFGDIDPAAGSGLLPSPLGQNLPHLRGRNGSQGSMGNHGRIGSGQSSVAGSNISGISQQRHMGFWLTPITMEQVVKKLTTELREAKQQSQELKRTTDFFGNLLVEGSTREESKSLLKEQTSGQQLNGVSLPPKVDSRTRYSDPPAPPPQQPLPEKPDNIRSPPPFDPVPQVFLRRADTERPRLSMSANTSPIKAESSSQITSLVEALASARKEIDSQSSKVKNLEDMLQQERLARESAEHRAHRLEMEARPAGLDTSGQVTGGSVLPTNFEPLLDSSRLARGVDHDEVEDTDIINEILPPASETQTKPSDPSQVIDGLQLRIKLMVMEMDEMKQQMESYKRRAESAEDEGASDRRSLAEMVEKIRKDDVEREGRRRSRRGSPVSKMQLEPSSKGSDRSDLNDVSRAHLQNARSQNGHSIGPAVLVELEKVVSAALPNPDASHGRVLQPAPYVSMLGVVIFGVGLMTFLNGWPKVER